MTAEVRVLGRPRGLELYILASAICGYAIAAIAGLAVRSPLGHDESVYALRARDLDMGWSTPTDGWTDYRAPGLPILLNGLGRVVGIHVTSSRLLVVLLGAVVIVGVWVLGRIFGSGLAGAFGALLVALASGFVYSSTTLLADVPGATFAMVAICVYAMEARRPVLKWSFLFLPLLTVAATTARFGAPFMIGAGLFSVALVRLPSVVRERNWIWLAQSLLLAVGVALSAALVLLTDVVSIGSLTPAEANRNLVDGKGLTAASGFEDLWVVVNPLSGFPVHLWSLPVAAACLMGIVVAALFALQPGPIRRMFVFGVVAGVLSAFSVAITVGLVVANYLALSLPFWALAAGAGWAGAAQWVQQQGHRSIEVIAAAGAVIAGSLLIVAVSSDTRSLHLNQQTAYEALRGVSLQANAMLDEDCLVITSSTPQVGYYSECAVERFSVWGPEVSAEDALADAVERGIARRGREFASVAVMVQELGKRQPPAEDFVQGELVGPVLAAVGNPGDGRQYVRLHLVDVGS